MKVNDLIQKCERDLTTAEITDMVAKDNRQVDLIFAEKRTDDAGYLTWDATPSSGDRPSAPSRSGHKPPSG